MIEEKEKVTLKKVKFSFILDFKTSLYYVVNIFGTEYEIFFSSKKWLKFTDHFFWNLDLNLF